MLQRFLNPAILAGISGLDLVAKTVVDDFIAGLHRSPHFGFSQEFAEYRAYDPGSARGSIDPPTWPRARRRSVCDGATWCNVGKLDTSRRLGYNVAQRKSTP